MTQIVTLSLIGYVLRRREIFSARFFAELSRFLVVIILPVFYFNRVSRTNVEDILSGLIFPLGAALVLLATLLFSYGFFTLLGYRGMDRRLGLALALFGNVGFMPIFLAELFPSVLPELQNSFGTTTPMLYMGFYLFVASPALWAGGAYLVNGTIGRPRIREFFSPSMFGIAAGLLVPLFGLQPLLFNPDYPLLQLMNAADSLSRAFFPLTLVCLGASFAAMKELGAHETPENLKLSLHVAVVRLLFIPGLFFLAYFLIIRPLQLSATHSWVFFLQMTVPSATSVSILATRAQKNEGRVAFAILLNYLLYIFVLPVYVMLFLKLPGIVYTLQ